MGDTIMPDTPDRSPDNWQKVGKSQVNLGAVTDFARRLPKPGTTRRLTHAEHSRRVRNATPCTVHDLTYGGRCLACGWDPERTTA
jgi:hypothetical protein